MRRISRDPAMATAAPAAPMPMAPSGARRCAPAEAATTPASVAWTRSMTLTAAGRNWLAAKGRDHRRGSGQHQVEHDCSGRHAGGLCLSERETEPAEPQQQGAERGEGEGLALDDRHPPRAAEPAGARSDHCRGHEPGHATRDMDHAAAGEVDETDGLQPAGRGPGPVGDQRHDQQRVDGDRDRMAAQRRALGRRPGESGDRAGRQDDVEQQGRRGFARQERSGTGQRASSIHDAVAEGPGDHDGQAQLDQRLGCDIDRVLGANEAAFQRHLSGENEKDRERGGHRPDIMRREGCHSGVQTQAGRLPGKSRPTWLTQRYSFAETAVFRGG
jgi:hypothetical protein